VVGATSVKGKPVIVLLDVDRTRIETIRTHPARFFQPPYRIAEVAVSPFGPLVAMAFESGELWVYSLARKQVVCKVSPGGATMEAP
jgi:hypothetical protein